MHYDNSDAVIERLESYGLSSEDPAMGKVSSTIDFFKEMEEDTK